MTRVGDVMARTALLRPPVQFGLGGETTVARSKPVKVTDTDRDVVLHRARSRKFPSGPYTMIVLRNGKVLGRRAVRLG